MKQFLNRMRTAGQSLFFRAQKATPEQVNNEAYQAIETGRSFEALAHTPGWKLFEAVLKEREDQLIAELRKAPPHGVLRLQAQLAELDAVKQIIPSALEQMERAREYLEREHVGGNDE